MKVLFRFDASRAKGLGHANRCLGLAQALCDAGHSVQALCFRSESDMLRSWQHEVAGNTRLTLEMGDHVAEGADAVATRNAAIDLGADWLVADDYDFDDAYYAAVRKSVPGLLVFCDDDGDLRWGDIVLNQNCRRGGSIRYEGAKGAVHLSGERYFVCRRAVQAKRALRDPERHPGSAILVTMGGADLQNVGLSVCRELLTNPGLVLDVDLACTADAAGLADARKLSAGQSRLRVHDRPDLVQLVDSVGRHAVAVCGGGVTSLELACMGFASVIIQQSDNQHHGAAALSDEGAALLAETPGTAADTVARLVREPRLARGVAERAMTLIDGQGGARVVDEMRAMSDGARPTE